MLQIATSDMLLQTLGSESVLYQCDVSGLKFSIAPVYHDDVYPPSTISANWRLKTPGEFLAVGMGGIVYFHFCDCSYVYTSLVGARVLFFLPPMATSLPLNWPRPNHLTGNGGRVVHSSCNGS